MGKEQHFDCLILGAGISGLDAAYHLQQHCKWADYAILERRSNLGGTWDFFKYPGIRSDSDMYTFGFSWKVWRSSTPIATGDEIIAYLKEAAEEQGITEKIRLNTNIERADWASGDNRWHLVASSGERFSCNVLFGCTGYFSYETPFEPAFTGQEDFPGTIVHPQKWTPEHDKMIEGKRVAMIGSGATAVTILPSIAESASHVTMVQRSPTYIAAKPAVSPLVEFLKKWLPAGIAVRVNRILLIMLGMVFYQYCVRFPNHAKRLIKKGMYKEVKGVMTREEFDKHFTPPYNPWEQRFCLAPDGDFFVPIREGKATIVTGHIDRFTQDGIKMKSGELVKADFIISATGLTIQQNFPFSTIKVTIDGKEYKAPDHLLYNAIMVSDVPNFGFVVGYTNASWTLKADIASLYFTKLLNHMRSNGVAKVVAQEDPANPPNHEVFNGGLTSGYFARSGAILPKQGDRAPWQGGTNYIIDLLSLTFGGIGKDSLVFTMTDKKTA